MSRRSLIERLMRRLRGPQDSLGARAIGAGLWNVGMGVWRYGFRLISNLIMTRLLLPDAFGMMALAATVLTALELFTDIGINRSIIREKDGEDSFFLRVAWVVKMLRGSLIAGGVLAVAALMWLLAPHLAAAGTVYARPEMPGLIALIALAPFLEGTMSTTRELTMRRLENRRFALFMMFSQLTSIGAMVLFAAISPTVWALMAGMLTRNLLQVAFTHLWLPGPKMRFAWDAAIAARLWHFGKWLLASSVLTFVARNADRLILGGLLGSASFGIYVIAQIWIDAARTFIARLSEAVGFPVVAEILRTRPHDVPRLYRKFQATIDLFCVGCFLGALFLGQWLIDALYTPAYALAGRYLELMSGGFLLTRFDPLNGLILNTGNSRSAVIISGVRAVGICVLLPLGFRLYGVEGAILAMVLTPALSVPYTLWLTRPILGARQSRFDLLWYLVSLAAIVAVPLWLA